MLEENTFHGHKADYVWLLTVSSALLLVSTTIRLDCPSELRSEVLPAPLTPLTRSIPFLSPLLHTRLSLVPPNPQRPAFPLRRRNNNRSLLALRTSHLFMGFKQFMECSHWRSTGYYSGTCVVFLYENLE